MKPAEKNMNICDIHTHVLPGVDDGAQSLSQALEMLENAAASDVTHLLATPHCNRLPGADTVPVPLQFETLRRAAEHIPVTLGLGAEVHVTPQLPKLLQEQAFPTLNGSRYLLTEFPLNYEAEQFLPMLEHILRLGYVPVVAHPERCDAVIRNPAAVAQWLEQGCHVQLTGAGILGKQGEPVRRTCEYLLKNGLVCCVASDAHNTRGRDNNLLEVQAYLSLYYSRPCAEALLMKNPMKLWHDEPF